MKTFRYEANPDDIDSLYDVSEIIKRKYSSLYMDITEMDLMPEQDTEAADVLSLVKIMHQLIERMATESHVRRVEFSEGLTESP